MNFGRAWAGYGCRKRFESAVKREIRRSVNSWRNTSVVLFKCNQNSLVFRRLWLKRTGETLPFVVARRVPVQQWRSVALSESRRMITGDHPLSGQSHRRAMIWWIETAVQHISVKLVATVFKKSHINMNGCVNFVIFITSFHKHPQTWYYFLFQTCINILDIEHS